MNSLKSANIAIKIIYPNLYLCFDEDYIVKLKSSYKIENQEIALSKILYILYKFHHANNTIHMHGIDIQRLIISSKTANCYISHSSIESLYIFHYSLGTQRRNYSQYEVIQLNESNVNKIHIPTMSGKPLQPIPYKYYCIEQFHHRVSNVDMLNFKCKYQNCIIESLYLNYISL